MFCLWGGAFVNSLSREEPAVQLQGHSFSRISPLSPLDQEHYRRQLEFSVSSGTVYISEVLLELNSKGFLTFKIWTCFVYFLETNILLWFILDMTYVLHLQALDWWWLAGDGSVLLKIHEVSLVFFSPCCKNFYSFLKREQLSKWRPMSKRNTQIKPWKQPKVNINILCR